MHKTLKRLSLVSLVCIFLVVLAGSIVRMTGSGMGCPDWPKCFGYYIPPTDIETLTWSEGKEFQKGNIVIRNDSLFVAQSDFTTSDKYDDKNWRHYTKHDYAIFNPTHTWVEFINRLIGALTGIPVLLLFVVSIFHMKRDPLVTTLAFAGVLLLGFEAWLGKEVVDGNLIPHQITYHMLGAIALVGLYTLLTIRLISFGVVFKARRDKTIVILGVVSLTLILVQIILGTTVREQVDAISKTELLKSKDWLDKLGIQFLIHRSFSIAVLIVQLIFAIRVIRTRSISTWPRILIVILFLEILAGMGLAYLDMPGSLQPLHLFLAILNFSLVVTVIGIYLRKTTY